MLFINIEKTFYILHFVSLFLVHPKAKDKSQQNNLANSNPEKRIEMKKLFILLRGEDYSIGVKEVEFK